MRFEEYQELSGKTQNPNLDYYKTEQMLIYGLNGEVGELTDLIKKCRFHGHGLNMNKLESELGDILWYLAQLCEHFHMDLVTVAEANIDKLKERYPDGFSETASINRTA